MLTPERTRFIGDEDAIEIWWYVNGALVDFSVEGYTFRASAAPVSDLTNVIFTKTDGFVGAAGSGTEESGTPNLTIVWATSGELNQVTTPGRYVLEVVATAGDGSESTYHMTLNMQTRLG